MSKLEDRSKQNLIDSSQSSPKLQQLLEKHLLEIIVNMNMIAVFIDLEGKVSFCNNYFLELTGFKKDEVIGSDWFLNFIPDYNKKIKTLFTDGLREGKITNHYENQIITKTGELRYIRWNNTILRDAQDGIMGTVSIGEDITERKKAEEALRENESKLKAAQRIAKIGSWTGDQNGQISWSEEMYRLYGVSPETFIPNQESFMSLVHPDDRGIVLSQISETFDSGTSSEIVFRVVRPDGSIRFINVLSERVCNIENGSFYLAGTAQDITERKQAEEVLQYNQELLEQMGRVAKIGGWEFDTVTGKGTWTDEVARIHDLDPNDETNVDRGLSFYHGESRVRIENAIKDAIELGKHYDLELELTTAKGVHKWVHTIGYPVIKNGKVINLRGSFQDITEHKLAEEEIKKLNEELELRVKQRTEQLEEVNKDLESFSYSVSHDLRAPLRHINGFVDLLTERFPDSLPEKGKHYLATIADSAHQMGVLIDDLLQFSRTGRRDLKHENLDMNLILKEALDQIKKENSERKIKWVIGNFTNVLGDHAMLRLVWINLLNNAVKFTRKRKNARIEVNSYINNNEVVFFVRDNGVGFDMKYSQKLFGVFQRLHSAAEFEGTGIGLANVKRIILKHRGRTWAEAKPGKGAVFYFALPLYKEGNK